SSPPSASRQAPRLPRCRRRWWNRRRRLRYALNLVLIGFFGVLLLSRRSFGQSPLAPVIGLHGRNGGVPEFIPVESDAWVLSLERRPEGVVERLAADANMGR